MNILLTGGQILTMAGEEAEVLSTDLGIVNDRIAFIGSPPSDFRADKTVDASDTLLMPGLINAHTHVSMSLLRSYADDLPFWDWLFGRIMPVEEKIESDDAYYGAQLSILEMIRSGTTTFADMYFFMDRVAQAVEESGIRANLSRGVTFMQGDKDLDKLTEAEEFYNNWNGKADGRIRVDIAPHAPYTCPPTYLKKCSELALKLNCNIHIHLSESRKEVEDSLSEHGQSPIAHVDGLGLFESRTYGAHCVHVSDKDIALMAAKGVTAVNNPTSNLKLANGFAPVKKLLDAGVNVALGTDGPGCNNNTNMFEEINLAGLINKGITEDPTVIPAYKALQMATVNGARALGLEDETGTLETGKKADLILIDLNKAHFIPRYNLVSSMVYAAQGSDVKTVICNGRILMEDYRVLTLDEQTILKNAAASASRMTAEEENS
ncbi:MAG: amidohydrolase [Spirochaetales bacterium]|nr:amidohydrolase [Spirochaetales bacterium]